MINVLGNAIFPVFLIAAIGALLGRLITVDVRSIGRLALFVFSPALIFAYLYDAEIPAVDVINIVTFLTVWLPALYIFCFALCVISRLRGQHRSSMLLTTMFMNAANYGLPVALFAFGSAGLERALIFAVPQHLMSGTLAVYIAASGSVGVKQALIAVTKMPTFYAVIAALILNVFNLGLPSAISTPINLLAGAAIPTMIIVLGIQLTNVSLKDDLLAAGVASIVRLIVSPVLALGATLLLGIDGITQQVLIVLSGMPTAVYTTILATEFETRPKQVTSAVATSTLMSLITVTTLVWLVQNYL
ncbi:MAG: hypothetical protein DK304_000831 [Chloroflexi bacterium]|nr:MAG: hypothetical protein DK304_000831 [Chloroflexota bacterium]